MADCWEMQSLTLDLRNCDAEFKLPRGPIFQVEIYSTVQILSEQIHPIINVEHSIQNQDRCLERFHDYHGDGGRTKLAIREAGKIMMNIQAEDSKVLVIYIPPIT